MRIHSDPSPGQRVDIFGPIAGPVAPTRKRAFTIMEVVVVMALLTILMVSGFGGILSMRLVSSRLTDHTAGLAVVEAKLLDIRAAHYNPPHYPFTAQTHFMTNNRAVALNMAGTTFMVPGTTVTRFQPVPGGHLVIVTGRFDAPNKPLTITLETVVNKFSGGMQ